MNVVILQPSYIPWRGYFDQIFKADIFVFYDDVQYDKHGWRNRNRILTHQGRQWLTIPVHTKGVVSQGLPINEIEIAWEHSWSERHWRAIREAYGKAPYFQEYAPWLEEVYQRRPALLADFTIPLTIEITRKLGNQKTQFLRSSELNVNGHKTDRLMQILTRLGATHYISGPSAREYFEEGQLEEAGITLEYMVYDYPPYPQIYEPFDPQISIIDLMMMTGSKAASYITAGGNSHDHEHAEL